MSTHMPRMPKPMVQAEVCGSCIHYHQHYVLEGRQKLIPLWYGHCGVPKFKGRHPDETCEQWEENLSDE